MKFRTRKDPMRITRREFLGAALAVAASPVAAQSGWPTARPVRIIVPFAAGGASDVAARVLAQSVSESLKTPVVVENKPGAHGTIGIGEVQRSPADGYTLLMGSTGTMAVNPRLHDKLPYDANKDFAPVSLVTISPNVVVINPTALPVKDMRELVDYLRANPGKVTYGTAGAGNSGHITTEYFKDRTKTQMTHIPNKGDAAAMNDLIGGHVQIMFTTVLAAMPHVTLHTPRDPSISAGLVCFEVAGLGPDAVVNRLLARQIVATTTPYSPSYARLAAGLFNTPDEVETVLREVRALA